MMKPRITLHPYRLPLTGAWPGSRQENLQLRRGWIIQLYAEQVRGMGDCAPMGGTGTESFPEAETLLKTWCNRPATDLHELLSGLEGLRASRPAACHALETAILDILARQSGRSLRELLCPTASSRILVNDMAGDACSADPAHSTENGYRIIKLKLGNKDAEEEINCLQKFCRALPAGIKLRLDANGAWQQDTASRVLEKLEGLPVESLEEPLTSADLDTLGHLQESTSVPLALDESLSRFPFDEVLDSNLPRLVIKPAVQGGLMHSYHLAERAAAAGKQCIVTSVVESAVGVHAACQLAAAMDRLFPGLAHGLATSTWLQKDIASPPQLEAGFILLSRSPGLGVDECFPFPVQSSFS
jgi:o-succinylbenzoate synthase